MADWTVVVWAAVTADLDEAFAADLSEVDLAVGAIRAGAIELMLGFTPGSTPATKKLIGKKPGNLGELADGNALRGALARNARWNDVKRKRLLVLWGHGADGVGGDTALAVPAAQEVVKAFPGPPGNLPKPPDIIGYDACRMASAPTVLELARSLPDSVFIGSMIPEPASGWPYAELLRVLVDNAAADAAAAAIVQSYAASVDVRDWCLIALYLKKIGTQNGPLATALGKLNGFNPPEPADFFDAASGADIGDDTDLVDLGALMRRLTDRTTRRGTSPESRVAAEVHRAIREAIISRRASGGLAGKDGLSVRLVVPPVGGPVGAPPQLPNDWSRFLDPAVF
jgi:Clostripain family